jgi:hypothetical protein
LEGCLGCGECYECSAQDPLDDYLEYDYYEAEPRSDEITDSRKNVAEQGSCLSEEAQRWLEHNFADRPTLHPSIQGDTGLGL